MSVQGWFISVSSNPKFPASLAYRCTACGIDYLFGDEKESKEPKAYCCGVWKTKPSEGWFNKLPIVPQVARRALVVLP
jgi:hypothetical protein